MILTGAEIKREHASGRIRIEPFNVKNVQPNSYDFHLGDTVLTYKDVELDVHKENETEETLIPKDGLLLTPNKIYLASSREVIGSDHYAPTFGSKSGAARTGIFSHLSCGLVDIGSHGRLTLQLHVVQPVKIYPGMRIAQVIFWKPQGEITLYDGKYQGAEGPQASRIHRDFL
ncbi:dCTP deaminase (plasmid) [Nocardiopsis eucommiae]|uniref:dCTP deaminase n=1 Tax=Nocardiopsis eucommiae TaxID=2831970 RepID=A0A975QMD9_9ACTN|nr:dCTP deaminase [Nocardiopsis eucommiae]